jgi:hypothetical protein
MSRYFFHTEGEHLNTDEERIDLPSVEATRAEAMQAAGEMLRDAGLRNQAWPDVPWRLWVTDGPGAAGATVVTVRVFLENGHQQPCLCPRGSEHLSRRLMLFGHLRSLWP